MAQPVDLAAEYRRLKAIEGPTLQERMQIAEIEEVERFFLTPCVDYQWEK